MSRNEQRAEYAFRAMQTFIQSNGDNGDAGANLTDLLCNLMHWADEHGVDFDQSLRIAKGHHEEETGPVPEEEVV